MPGFLHKRGLQECHPALCQALPFAPPGIYANHHSKVLDPCNEALVSNLRLYNRSLYAYVHIYNRLPQTLVDAPTVSSFQARLTHLAKQRAIHARGDWRKSFQDCQEIVDMFYAAEAA